MLLQQIAIRSKESQFYYKSIGIEIRMECIIIFLRIYKYFVSDYSIFYNHEQQ